MELSVKQISEMIDATRIIGDAACTICGVNSFEDADATQITFASDPRYIRQLKNTKAGAVIIPESADIDSSIMDRAPVLLVTGDPKRSFFNMVTVFHPPPQIAAGIHPTAVIGADVDIGKKVFIGPGAVIEDRVSLGDCTRVMANVYIGSDSRIGSGTTIKPNVTLMEHTVVGDHVLIHSGTVIGSDGYGFTQHSDSHEKVIHTGFVQIGNHVEIGACNTIDRGTLGKTVIGNGVKTDNLVHIAHNVKIGDHCLIVAQVGIAGSTQLGRNVIVAGKAGISGHLTIGDNSIVGPYAGVHSNVGPNEIVSGIPQLPHKKWRKVVSTLARLPEMRKTLISIERRIEKLEQQ